MGQAPHTMEEALARLSPALRELAARLVLSARENQEDAEGCSGPVPPTEPVMGDAAGWSFLLDTHKHDGTEHWHFSARMQPIGRGSKRLDWAVLGLVVAEVQERSGHPTHLDPPESLTPFETTHPNRAHHWAWHGDGSPLDPDHEAQLRALLSADLSGRKS